MVGNVNIVRFNSLESTNKYCEALDLSQVEDFTCFWALTQTAGIGQQGNHWEAQPGKNLTFSLVLHPSFLSAERQFKLTQALTLALTDFLAHFVEKSQLFIKWPNDIYVGGDKICGILVSNRLKAYTLATAICGIGFNVNQRLFPEWVPNPTSLSLLTGSEYSLETTLHQLLHYFECRYRQLKEGSDFGGEYLSLLLNLNSPAQYYYQGREIMAMITGVDDFGRLLLVDEAGNKLCCGMKEISLIQRNSIRIPTAR